MRYRNFKTTFSVFFLFLFVANIFISAFPVTVSAAGTTYYIDSAAGNDSSNGTSVQTAWKTLTKVNGTSFQPGDSVLFKSGGSWTGQLNITHSGSAGNVITYTSYGEGAKPIINGAGSVEAAIRLYNVSYIEVIGFELTNTLVSNPYTGIHYGIRGVRDVGGTSDHIHIKDNYVHDVTGASTSTTAEGGGISFACVGNESNAKFNDLLIENNHVSNVIKQGINAVESYWLTFNPTTNLVIRGNRVERSGWDSILVNCSEGALVENNISYYAGAQNGNRAICGIWPWYSKNTIIQYNESYATDDWTDGQGFDIDYGTDGTIIQYNYSHDNANGFLLHCNYDGGATKHTSKNSIIRYNISQNDLGMIFKFAGTVNNAQIYNNTIYSTSATSSDYLIYVRGNGGTGSNYSDLYASNLTFKNNIFINPTKFNYYNLHHITNSLFDSNVFYTPNHTGEPTDANKITSDPKLIAPNTGGIGRDTVAGYKLAFDSPCIDSGAVISNNGGKDYWGGTLYNNLPDRGAHEYGSSVVSPTPTPPEPITSPTPTPTPTESPIVDRVYIDDCVVYPGDGDPGGKVHTSTWYEKVSGIGGILYNYKNFVVTTKTPPNSLLEFRFTVNVASAGSYKLFAETSKYDIPSSFSTYLINVNDGEDVFIDSSKVLESTPLIANNVLIKYRYFDIQLNQGVNTIVFKAQKMSQPVGANNWNFNMGYLTVEAVDGGGSPTSPPPTSTPSNGNVIHIEAEEASPFTGKEYVTDSYATNGAYYQIKVAGKSNLPAGGAVAVFTVYNAVAGAYNLNAVISKLDDPAFSIAYMKVNNGEYARISTFVNPNSGTMVHGGSLRLYDFGDVILTNGTNTITFMINEPRVSYNDTTERYYMNIDYIELTPPMPTWYYSIAPAITDNGDGTADISAKVMNNSGSPANPVMLAAVYAPVTNILSCVRVLTPNIAAGAEGSYLFENLPLPAGYTCKIFYWNTSNDISPLIKDVNLTD